VPVVTAAVAWWHWRALERGREVLPFVLTMALFLLSFLGLGISLWPTAVTYYVFRGKVRPGEGYH
jgi:cytochrome d ubiquinol oxidase subunit II